MTWRPAGMRLRSSSCWASWWPWGEASRGLFEPLAKLKSTPLSLDPSQLPFYAARTTLRMFVALGVSLVFTFTYATWAAKSPRAGKLLVPILDILQSVPILSFISITVVFFMSLAPGRVLGAEFVAIFAIFTSQAWNMAFSFYQSLRTVPYELREAARSFHLSGWMTFWQVEVPFSLPGLIWNTMMSMSGGWFFVVASEALTVGHTSLALPGIGSYIAVAIEQRNLVAIGWAIATMLVVILLYDQLLFRPLVAWADRLKFEQDATGRPPSSWALTVMQRSRLLSLVTDSFFGAVRWSSSKLPTAKPLVARAGAGQDNVRRDRLFMVLVIAVVGLACGASRPASSRTLPSRKPWRSVVCP
ncbi:MAG: ABC transporter permease subunit [Steroidobacteraceae bacterium]